MVPENSIGGEEEVARRISIKIVLFEELARGTAIFLITAVLLRYLIGDSVGSAWILLISWLVAAAYFWSVFGIRYKRPEFWLIDVESVAFVILMLMVGAIGFVIIFYGVLLYPRSTSWGVFFMFAGFWFIVGMIWELRVSRRIWRAIAERKMRNLEKRESAGGPGGI